MAIKKTVIKHSAVIQVTHKISLLEQHLYNVLLAEAFNDLDSKKGFHSIKISEIKEYIPSIDNVAQLKTMLTNLHKTEITYNLFDKDKNKDWKQKEWGIFGFLSEAWIGKHNKICYFNFPSKLIPFLMNPTMYSKIDLELQKRYKGGKLGWNLYELCYDYKSSISKEAGRTPAMTIDQLKDFSGIKKQTYQTYKSLNQRVILPAIKEINNQTDIHIDTEIKRVGRQISHISFIITDKTDYSNVPPLIPLTGNPGITESVLKRSRKKYSEEAIEEALQCCRETAEPRTVDALFSRALSYNPPYESKKTKKLNKSKRCIKADKKAAKAKDEAKANKKDEYLKATNQDKFTMLQDDQQPPLQDNYKGLNKEQEKEFRCNIFSLFTAGKSFDEINLVWAEMLFKAMEQFLEEK